MERGHRSAAALVVGGAVAVVGVATEVEWMRGVDCWSDAVVVEQGCVGKLADSRWPIRLVQGSGAEAEEHLKAKEIRCIY